MKLTYAVPLALCASAKFASNQLLKEFDFESIFENPTDTFHAIFPQQPVPSDQGKLISAISLWMVDAVKQVGEDFPLQAALLLEQLSLLLRNGKLDWETERRILPLIKNEGDSSGQEDSRDSGDSQDPKPEYLDGDKDD